MIDHHSIKYFNALCQAHPGLELLVVSKYATHNWIREIHEITGWVNFGENRIDSLEEKVDLLQDLPLIWHYIGPLQSRKVERITRCAHHIQSVGRAKDLLLIDGYAKSQQKKIAVWVQVNDSDIKNRSGVPSDQVPGLVELAKKLENVDLQGMMILPEKGDWEAYQKLNQLRQSLDGHLKLSAGMSQDHLIAIEHGSNMIRIGRALIKN
jgi:uncharacterized pyridoxal phosphate-containing UPF0001 family protein